jgi:predicted acetyltransferase
MIEIDSSDTELFTRWVRTRALVFQSHDPGPLERSRARTTGLRLWGAMDGPDVVATFGDFDAELPVPAATALDPDAQPAMLPASLITAVTVLPTHRRRGLLSAWMRSALRDAKERGLPVASLIASESGIYGRYGFGVVVDALHWRADVSRSRGTTDPRSCPVHGTHRIRITDETELGVVGPDLYEAARRRQPAAAPRRSTGWDELLRPYHDPGPRARFALVHEPADARPARDPGSGAARASRVDGYAWLSVTSTWEHRDPASVAEVADTAALDPRIQTCLWRACLALDLVTTVEGPDRPVGDPLPYVTADPRGARVVDRGDMYWWRLLDTAATLRARSWSAPTSLVLEVVDPDGLAGGRFGVDVGPDGRADVSSTDRSADLTIGVADAAALACGERSLLALHAAGRLDEHRSGTVREFDVAARWAAPSLIRYQWF